MLFDFFECGLFPYIPIMDHFDNISVSFIFGDRDWVDSSGSEILILKKRESGGNLDCQLHVVKNASH